MLEHLPLRLLVAILVASGAVIRVVGVRLVVHVRGVGGLVAVAG